MLPDGRTGTTEQGMLYTLSPFASAVVVKIREPESIIARTFPLNNTVRVCKTTLGDLDKFSRASACCITGCLG
ncbi:hypothetical protein TNCV_3690401 [Trichonephila clavipes]|uniref:Uncharacterized protein n=1 Tax=Trichonephila clavipes TaxID=2585209 RepID=A0A8X6SNF7_TRICX|nr:hypothetical protein TNCV_3690401 [Trichonephila clavipes]